MSIKLKKILFSTIALSFIPISLIGGGFSKGSNKNNQFATKIVDESLETKPPFNFGNGEITQFVSGYNHSGAVVEDKTGVDQLYMWGSNDSGQLGDNSRTESSAIPTDITSESVYNGIGPLNSNQKITHLALGNSYSGAVVETTNSDKSTTDRLYMWGSDAYGELGNGITNYNGIFTPIDITSGNADNGIRSLKPNEKITQLALGSTHSGAVVEDETGDHLWMWGTSYFGDIGDGEAPRVEFLKPIDITSGNSDNGIGSLNSNQKITHLALGNRHSGAVVNESGVDHLWMWGKNDYGQLGDGGKESYSSTPIDITSGNADNGIRLLKPNEKITHLALGHDHSGAVVRDKTGFDHLYTWGENNYGQLGNYKTDTDSHPIPIEITNWSAADGTKSSNPNQKITHLALGNRCSGAVVKGEDGIDHLYMWGSAVSGELGNGGKFNDDVPANGFVIPTPTDITRGSNTNGIRPLKSDEKITQFSLRSSHSGAVVEDKTGANYLYMWGANGGGQLGNGDDKDIYTPMKIGYSTNNPLVTPLTPLTPATPATLMILYIIVGFISIILILAIILTIYSGVKETKRNKRLSQ